MLMVLLILAALALFALAAWLLQWRPIDSWRNFHKRWSTWLHGAGFLNVAAYLGIWNQMPFAVQRLMPDRIFLAIGVILWVAGVAAAYVKQEKLNGRA